MFVLTLQYFFIAHCLLSDAAKVAKKVGKERPTVKNILIVPVPAPIPIPRDVSVPKFNLPTNVATTSTTTRQPTTTTSSFQPTIAATTVKPTARTNPRPIDTTSQQIINPFSALLVLDQDDSKATITNSENGRPKCFQYDRRYQAASLEEAILNFPDLTMNNWRVETLADQRSNCIDEQCKSCVNSLITKLKNVDPFTPTDLANARKSLSVPESNSFTSTQQCPRLNYAKHLGAFVGASDDLANSESTDQDLKNVVNKLSSKGSQRWSKRSKRETSYIGQQTTVRCVKRGEPLDQDTYQWLGLCSECWTWRRLPDNYFPQFVNELVCDSDVRCLSGWGTCQQGTKNVDVMLKTENIPGNVTWQMITLAAQSSCNCQIKAGSVLTPLVVG